MDKTVKEILKEAGCEKEGRELYGILEEVFKEGGNGGEKNGEV